MVRDSEWDEVIPLADKWRLLKDKEGNVFLAYKHELFSSVLYMGVIDVPKNSTLESAINMLRSQGEIETRTQ